MQRGMYDRGSFLWAPHTTWSSCRHFRCAGLKESRVSRTCTSSAASRWSATHTHVVQIVDDPFHIPVAKSCNAGFVLFPREEVSELMGKLG